MFLQYFLGISFGAAAIPTPADRRWRHCRSPNGRAIGLAGAGFPPRLLRRRFGSGRMGQGSSGAALFTDKPLARNLSLLAALAACALLFAIGLDHHARWLWGLAIAGPLAAIGVYDLFQTRHSLRRNYPLTARARWFFEWLRPFLRSYI